MSLLPIDQIKLGDCLEEIPTLPDESIDLVVADPPYSLGKDFGNESDSMSPEDFLSWTEDWLAALRPKLKITGSLYIFCSWQFSPEIFVIGKRLFEMVNEIIWDRKVPSMGGTTRRFSSVHDNIGFFVRSRKDYYFDLDPVRIPYDEETKKARSRKRFEGAKWLELGYNPKDVWSISRLHRLHREREDHPTQKPVELIERMVKSSCPPGGVVLDPFMGSGSTAAACVVNDRRFVGFEINPDYKRIADERIRLLLSEPSLFDGVEDSSVV